MNLHRLASTTSRSLSLSPHSSTALRVGIGTLAVLLGSNTTCRSQCATQWQALESIDGGKCLAAMPNGDLIAGGPFSTGTTAPADYIVRWDGTRWTALGSGLGPPPVANSSYGVEALAMLPGGDLIATGAFTTAGGAPANNIARWDGASWWPLGSGLGGSMFSGGLAVTATGNGDVVVGGDFTTAGGVPANHIARWNGTAWSSLGIGINGPVHALLALPNGDVIAGGAFTTAGGANANNIARWDGSTWHALGAGTNDRVQALTSLPNGDLAIGGYFTSAGTVPTNYLARWNGTTWSGLAPGLSGSQQLWFVPHVSALAILPNSDLVAAGWFNSPAWPSLARWDGASWTALGSGGMFVQSQVGAWFEDLAVCANGDLAVLGGGFHLGSTHGAARVTTTCPATLSPVGAGCFGSGGLNTLAATSLPWTGSTFTSRATGMPQNGLALHVLGFGLMAMPIGEPGCMLLANPNATALLVPLAGLVETSLAIPDVSNLAGLVLRQQVVAADFGPSNTSFVVTTTNAVSLTIGTF